MNDSERSFDQRNQTVSGHQANIAGDARIEHLGDVINQYIMPGEEPPLFAGVPDLPRYGLVGRDPLMIKIIARLTGAPGATLALSGAGGTGKTALAVAAARNQGLLEHFTDGVLWASAGPGGDPLPALGKWAEVLQIDPRDYPEPGALKEAVKDAIGQRQLLLVIDDVWDKDQAELLRCGGPNCAHLLTTRDKGIAGSFAGGGENVLVVPELDLEPAFELLQTIAPQACDVDEDAARELVRQVGGLPLAVELLGGYLTAEGMSDADLFGDLDQEMLQDLGDPALRLNQAQARLGDGSGEKLPLSAVVSLSLDGFNEEEQAAYFALGAFAAKPATFSREAAEAVSVADGRLLRRLYNRNLLEIIDKELALHQLTADLARQKMDEEAQARHALYYMTLVRDKSGDWQAIDAVYDQIRMAWNNAEEEIYLAWIWAMLDHQFARGYWAESLAWVERGLAYARANELRDDEADMLNQSGNIHIALGRRAEALHFFEEALAIHRAEGNRLGEAVTLMNLGLLYHKTGYQAQAMELFTEALPVLREEEDRAGEATLLNYMGLVADSLSDHQEALWFYRQALEIQRDLDDPASEITILNNIAAAMHATGQPMEALESYHESLEIAQNLGHRSLEATILSNMATVYATLDQYDAAFELLSRSLAIYQEIGRRASEATVLSVLASLYRIKGVADLALQLYWDALVIMREVGDRAGEAEILHEVADIYREQEDFEQALEIFEGSLAIRREMGDRASEARTLFYMAILFIQTKEFDRAVDALQTAIALFEDGLEFDSSGDTVKEYRSVLQELQNLDKD